MEMVIDCDFDCMIEEINYFFATNDSIVHDDEQIKAHKGKESCHRFDLNFQECEYEQWVQELLPKGWELKEDYSCVIHDLIEEYYQNRGMEMSKSQGHNILLQIHAFCYRFSHSDTDTGILLQIQAFCYRFRHIL